MPYANSYTHPEERVYAIDVENGNHYWKWAGSVFM